MDAIQSTAPTSVSTHASVRDDLLGRMRGASGPYLAAVAICAAIVAWALFAWGYQIVNGFGHTGVRRPVYWGFYIVNFVFWIGISHAGTLISAILRLTGAEWRKPVTRAAEAITVFCLMIGGLFPLIHISRSWFFYWMLPYPNERLLWPNFRSPLFWDLTAILTYLSGSVIYLYLPLIPDVAELANRSTGLKRRIYRALSLGWSGSDRQWQALERAMKLMAAAILAIAVSVHSVVAYDFSMSVTPTWHNTIFAPYFVVGAIFSGIAALVLVMVSLRKLMGLERYLREVHFVNLSKLLLLMSLIWGYFTFSEHLTTWYGNLPSEVRVFQIREHGLYGILFWTMVACNFVVPFVLIGISRLRSIPTIAVSSVAVLIGMWIERFLIVIPPLSTPALAAAWGSYSPSWVELSITAGTFAAMVLLYLLFVKAFPIIAIWEYDDEVPAR
jgi:molybdopterin-containing oxidoreductase family membrane subunit